jgi:hypothetical protein
VLVVEDLLLQDLIIVLAVVLVEMEQHLLSLDHR